MKSLSATRSCSHMVLFAPKAPIGRTPVDPADTLRAKLVFKALHSYLHGHVPEHVIIWPVATTVRLRSSNYTSRAPRSPPRSKATSSRGMKARFASAGMLVASGTDELRFSPGRRAGGWSHQRETRIVIGWWSSGKDGSQYKTIGSV